MSKRIAAFGEVMMRLEVPGGKLLLQEQTLHYSFSGTGVNVASALARYGYTGQLITTLPDNSVGDAAKAYLQKLGIDTVFVQRGGSYVGSYFLEHGFGARSSKVTYTNRLASSFNTAAAESYPFEHIAEQLDIVMFCGITLAMNEQVRTQMKQLAREVKKRGGKVVFDCNYRPSLWGGDGYDKAKPHYEDMLRLSDLVMMNEQDAIHILGLSTIEHERQDQLAELLPLVARGYNIPVISGTQRTIYADNRHALRGFLYKNDRLTIIENEPFPVLDRIGAGDAYTSGIIYGLLEQLTAEESISFALAASLLAHTTVGDTPLAGIADIQRAQQLSIGDVQR